MPLTGVALHDMGLWNWCRDVVVRQIRDKACCRGRRCTSSDRVQCHVTSAVRIASRARCTRVSGPELRAYAASQGSPEENKQGEGLKPFGSDPSSCRINAAR